MRFIFIELKNVSGSTYIPAKKGKGVGYLFIYMPDKRVIYGILTNRKAEPNMRARSLAVSLTSLK